MSRPPKPASSIDQSDKSEVVRRQLWKTQACWFFARGLCHRGEKCSFSHGAIESAPDLSKTSLCKAYKKGLCALPSANCRFAHGMDELRMTPLFKQAHGQAIPPKPKTKAKSK